MPYPVKKDPRPNLIDFGVYVQHGNWYDNLKKLLLRSPCSKHIIYYKKYFNSSGQFTGDPEKP